MFPSTSFQSGDSHVQSECRQMRILGEDVGYRNYNRTSIDRPGVKVGDRHPRSVVWTLT